MKYSITNATYRFGVRFGFEPGSSQVRKSQQRENREPNWGRTALNRTYLEPNHQSGSGSNPVRSGSNLTNGNFRLGPFRFQSLLATQFSLTQPSTLLSLSYALHFVMTNAARHPLSLLEDSHISEDPLWTMPVTKDLYQTNIISEERDLQCPHVNFSYWVII